MVITEDIIRTVLRFNDTADDRVDFPVELITGCFQRMGYQGDITVNNLMKPELSPSWRYLMHILIMRLGPHKEGYDYMTRPAQSMMVA